MSLILINSQIVKKSQAKIAVEQRICRFGDGVFATCKIIEGVIYNFENHFKQLESGLKALKISFKTQDFLNLEKKSKELVKKNKTKNGILRISISRGGSSLGYLPLKETKPLIIAEILPPRKILTKKLVLGISEIEKPSAKSIPVFAKLISSTSLILAKIEARERKIFDVVMLNKDGFVCETSSANIFWIKNDEIYTPAKDCDILLGTTREKVIELFPKKIKEVRAKISVLSEADEIFLTNAGSGLIIIDELIINKKIKRLEMGKSLQIAKILKEDIKEYVKKQKN